MTTRKLLIILNSLIFEKVVFWGHVTSIKLFWIMQINLHMPEARVADIFLAFNL